MPKIPPASRTPSSPLEQQEDKEEPKLHNWGRLIEKIEPFICVMTPPRTIESSKELNKHNIKKRRTVSLPPFSGIISWLRRRNDNKANKEAFFEDGKEVSEDRFFQICSKRADELFKLCKKPSDIILLTFRSGSHSALIVYDEVQGKPAYLSYGSNDGYSGEGGDEKKLYNDIVDYDDLLLEKNITSLNSMNNNKILKEWRNNIKPLSFNPFTYNCSAVAKKLLLLGLPKDIKQTDFNNDRYWQMPSNTRKLAQEIQQRLGEL